MGERLALFGARLHGCIEDHFEPGRGPRAVRGGGGWGRRPRRWGPAPRAGRRRHCLETSRVPGSSEQMGQQQGKESNTERPGKTTAQLVRFAQLSKIHLPLQFSIARSLFLIF